MQCNITPVTLRAKNRFPFRTKPPLPPPPSPHTETTEKTAVAGRQPGTLLLVVITGLAPTKRCQEAPVRFFCLAHPSHRTLVTLESLSGRYVSARESSIASRTTASGRCQMLDSGGQPARTNGNLGSGRGRRAVGDRRGLLAHRVIAQVPTYAHNPVQNVDVP